MQGLPWDVETAFHHTFVFLGNRYLVSVLRKLFVTYGAVGRLYWGVETVVLLYFLFVPLGFYAWSYYGIKVIR